MLALANVILSAVSTFFGSATVISPAPKAVKTRQRTALQPLATVRTSTGDFIAPNRLKRFNMPVTRSPFSCMLALAPLQELPPNFTAISDPSWIGFVLLAGVLFALVGIIRLVKSNSL